MMLSRILVIYLGVQPVVAHWPSYLVHQILTGVYSKKSTVSSCFEVFLASLPFLFKYLEVT